MRIRKKTRQWSPESESRLNAFIEKPTYANLSRFIVAFQCSAECAKCGALAKDGECRMFALVKTDDKDRRYNWLTFSTIDFPDASQGRLVATRCIRIRWSEAKNYQTWVRINLKNKLPAILLSAIQLQQFLSVLRDDKILKEE